MGFCQYSRGDYVVLNDKVFRITDVLDADTVCVRRARWWELAWLWLINKVQTLVRRLLREAQFP